MASSITRASLSIAYGILAMTVIVTASNFLVQYPINDWITWGALTYPVAFLVTDLTNRRLGAQCRASLPGSMEQIPIR